VASFVYKYCARYYEGQLDGATNIDIRSLAAAAEVTARGLHALAAGDATTASTLQACAGSCPPMSASCPRSGSTGNPVLWLFDAENSRAGQMTEPSETLTFC